MRNSPINIDTTKLLTSSEFSAKGQMITSTGAGTRTTFSAGLDGHVLQSDSASPSGFSWAAVASQAKTNYSPEIKGSTTGGTVTYTKNYGRVVRTGDIVEYFGHIQTSDNLTGGTGNLIISLGSGAPLATTDSGYRAVASIVLVSPISVSGQDLLANPVGYISENSNYIELFIPQGRGGFGSPSDSYAQLTANTTTWSSLDIIFSIRYEAQ